MPRVLGVTLCHEVMAMPKEHLRQRRHFSLLVITPTENLKRDRRAIIAGYMIKCKLFNAPRNNRFSYCHFDPS